MYYSITVAIFSAVSQGQNHINKTLPHTPQTDADSDIELVYTHCQINYLKCL